MFAEDNGTGSDVGTGSSIGEKLIETPPVLNNDENIFKMFSINRSMESIQSSSNVPRNGLVAEYLFEGNANDTSGKGNNGWLANVRFMNGVEGQSSSFGGYYNPGHIRVPNNSSLQFGNELSISFWVKFNDYSGMDGRGRYSTNGAHAVIAKDHDRSGFVLDISGNTNDNGTICSWFLNNGFSQPLFSINGCLANIRNEWAHIAYVIKNNSAILYINEKKISTIQNANINFSQANLRDMYIGKFSDTRYPMNGGIDNLRIYKRALGESEIKSLYNEGLSVYDNPKTQDNIFDGQYDFIFGNLGCKYSQVPFNPVCIDSLTKEQFYLVNGTLQKITSTTINPQDESDPISIPTGEFTYNNTLMSLPSKGLPFNFDILYKSQTYYNGPVGINFDHNYNLFLKEDESGNVDYYNGKLSKIIFAKKTDGTFEYQKALNATLGKNGDEYTITYDNGNKEKYGTNLRIKELSNKNGDKLSFEYDNENKLIKVIDALGRYMVYSYYEHSRLQKVTDFNGRFVEFAYFGENEQDGNQYDLKNITINNGGSTPKTIAFTYTKVDGENANYLSHNI
ncbi:MAG: DUF6531 domain-containing protein, partial [Candidatus Gracilibacteria bacterium]|nr:DUF6531 domain-containing protein [Candidatus Gracilibacteria bacterium]